MQSSSAAFRLKIALLFLASCTGPAVFWSIIFRLNNNAFTDTESVALGLVLLEVGWLAIGVPLSLFFLRLYFQYHPNAGRRDSGLLLALFTLPISSMFVVPPAIANPLTWLVYERFGWAVGSLVGLLINALIAFAIGVVIPQPASMPRGEYAGVVVLVSLTLVLMWFLGAWASVVSTGVRGF